MSIQSKIMFDLCLTRSPSGADKKTKRPEKVSRDIPEKRHLDDGRAKLEVCQERALTLNGFLQFVTDRAQGDATPVWRALMACGFDLHFDRSDINTRRFDN